MLLPRLLPAETGSSGGTVQLVLLAIPLLMVVVILLMSRRRQREAEERAAAVEVGDHVVTASGMLGRVIELGDDTARLEIAPGVVAEFHRRAVLSSVEPTDHLTPGASGVDGPIKEQ